MPKLGKNRCFGALTMAFTILLAVIVTIAITNAPAAGAQVAVSTYHNDNYRTGWNYHETALTPANVNSKSFGLLHTVPLNDQVDAQPLVVPGVSITAGNYQGVHDVVYVATESNTVYAIDAHSGTVLLNPTLGPPVVMPIGCGNNGQNVGINSTPVIDLSSGTLYVMVYNQDESQTNYRLHALDLGSLTDKVTPQVVSASYPLTNGAIMEFNPMYQRQRPALLLANGSIYAGFGSFCDSTYSRGWLLGWSAGTLAPFSDSLLTDQEATSPEGFFLSSLWMSGYGPSADDSGNVLFVTGNSDYSGKSYNSLSNIAESVVKVPSSLNSVLDLFTPMNQATLDKKDEDFGSGGVMVLPDQPGSIPHLAVAAGKVGMMFLMDEDNLGGYSSKHNNVVGSYGIGACWCGPSYYVDPSDGLGHVVASGNRQVTNWRVETSPSPYLSKVGISPSVGGGQDPGFFTSISSNGTASPIIWALSRPGSQTYLFALDPESRLKIIFKASTGGTNLGGDANLVPVVANGQVFVASAQQLTIFGPIDPPKANKIMM